MIDLILREINGLDVQLYASGADAVENPPDQATQLILLDMMMPGLDGLETMCRLRCNPAQADTPMVFMTAKTRPKEVSTYLAAGAFGVIAKPFEAMELGEQLRKFWHLYKTESASRLRPH